jgi:hypothetical protein
MTADAALCVSFRGRSDPRSRLRRPLSAMSLLRQVADAVHELRVRVDAVLLDRLAERMGLARVLNLRPEVGVGVVPLVQAERVRGDDLPLVADDVESAVVREDVGFGFPLRAQVRELHRQ